MSINQKFIRLKISNIQNHEQKEGIMNWIYTDKIIPIKIINVKIPKTIIYKNSQLK